MACERATVLLSAITEVKKHGAGAIPLSGPDLTKGVTVAEFFDGKLAGHVGARRSCWYPAGPNFRRRCPLQSLPRAAR
jgi:hypothetical protein